MLTLRIVAVVGVVVLALLGLMLVFGVASQQLQGALVKVASVVGIITAASLLIGVVTKKSS